MMKKYFIRIIAVCILFTAMFSNAAYAAEFDAVSIVNTNVDITEYLGLLTVLIFVLGLILIGLFIVLIISYTSFNKKMQGIYKIIEDREYNRNENVINIRKHNDKELLEKLYGHIDERLDEISKENTGK